MKTSSRITQQFVQATFFAAALACAQLGHGQLLTPQAPQSVANPLDPTMKPGKAVLLDLEAKFAKDVSERGGEGFAAWFADDGTVLSNGAAPIIGKVAVAKNSKWLAKDYQLTWTPTDAVMGPSGDMGYTWGHYEGRGKDNNGNPVLTSGRYMTIWRKESDGSWKVILDAGATEPPEGGACCKLPGTN
jgi:ketosteroid isomerase-like protein